MRLRERAAARSIAPEDAARVEVIYKEMRPGLTGDERTDLDHLQGIVAARLAPVDRKLIAVTQEVQRRAKEMRDAASP